MKKVNFEKVVSDLNEQLTQKYDSVEILNACPFLESPQLRTFFELSSDNYGSELIVFSNMVVYSAMIEAMEDHNEENIKSESIKAFNLYLDALKLLKL